MESDIFAELKLSQQQLTESLGSQESYRIVEKILSRMQFLDRINKMGKSDDDIRRRAAVVELLSLMWVVDHLCAQQLH